ncbi:unnamed protein product [Rotaria sordida]|uniref:Uncharacterized protein n=1 Tax=Rotaria sordida TaxID=392033 RepID=A0A820BIC7_9BILA|nr:unnamed protein product [Rotaria sordida]
MTQLVESNYISILLVSINLKKNYAQRLVQIIANNQDPHITKLLNENEDVLDHFYKVQCPFVLPYQRRLVVYFIN